MSFFASHTQKTIVPPSDPDATITIQKLPGRHLRAAREQEQFASIAQFRKFGGAELQKELAALPKGEADKVRRDPLTGYHIPTLLEHGVKAWSFDAPITPDGLADADDDDQEFIDREILRLSKPSLFVESDPEAEAQVKNDSSSSSVH